MAKLQPVLFDNGIPSSFWKAPIELPGGWSVMKVSSKVFPSNEHYFHCCKVALCDKGTREMYEDILQARTAREAKRLGRLVPMDNEEIQIWNEREALVAMLEANLAKFQQHKRCRDWLLGTGRRRLIEHRPDKIWGDGMDGTGKNQLGKILELVRATLR